MTTTTGTSSPLTKKDFASDQTVRWCPGCGDYAILSAIHSVLPTLGIPKENFVVISGIGCASRFPYYTDTFGFHTIHGRAPAIATGVKMANPDLSVWVVTGDGDALSIGGNHLIHAMRRNIDLKILLFNNRIYGLTKGQASPTSELGKATKSTPMGTADEPFNPLALALGANARFVARSVDVFGSHLKSVLSAAAAHRGSGFIEIFQNCVIFNDKTFDPWTEKSVRDDRLILLEDGQPLVYGKKQDRGIRLNHLTPELVEFGGEAAEETGENPSPPDDLLQWNPTEPDPTLAYMMAYLSDRPGYPLPIGVLRNISEPTYESRVHDQLKQAVSSQGQGDLERLIRGGNSWNVE